MCQSLQGQVLTQTRFTLVLASCRYDRWAMRLTYNIDRRGKLARMIYGIALLFVGILLCFFWASRQGEAWRWVIAIACTVSGAFSIFEAWAGWCVVRAIGFRIPM